MTKQCESKVDKKIGSGFNAIQQLWSGEISFEAASRPGGGDLNFSPPGFLKQTRHEKYKIASFVEGEKFSLELSEFAPKGGYEIFLHEFCQFTGELFYDWFQGVESGIGHLSYLGTTLTAVWNDFPDSFSFDCDSKELAISLQGQLEKFLHNQFWSDPMDGQIWPNSRRQSVQLLRSFPLSNSRR